MNHCEALRQGHQRLNQIDSVHWCPLGSGAIAGNALGIDRDALAFDLGFKNGPSLNAANSTGNRDAVLGKGYTDDNTPFGPIRYMQHVTCSTLGPIYFGIPSLTFYTR